MIRILRILVVIVLTVIVAVAVWSLVIPWLDTQQRVNGLVSWGESEQIELPDTAVRATATALALVLIETPTPILPTPDPTFTPVPTITPYPTSTAVTPLPTVTRPPTTTVTPTMTRTQLPTVTATRIPTATPSPRPTLTLTPQPTPTAACLPGKRLPDFPPRVGAWWRPNPNREWVIVHFWTNWFVEESVKQEWERQEHRLLLRPGDDVEIAGGGSAWSWPADKEACARSEFQRPSSIPTAELANLPSWLVRYH